MIDLAVTYVYERDKQWAQSFRYWKEKEILEHKADKNNRQAFGIERIREWDMFKYWFRGVEQNCPWINKIFLIVATPNQIPKWLDTKNKKIRIVYHDEFMPQEYLPTFNPMTIQMYICNIEDLSEHYIITDDDCFFLNSIEKDRFFKEDKPVQWDNKVNYELFNEYMLNGEDGVFYSILNNNLIFEQKFMKEKVKYGLYHLPEARSKSFEKEILDKYSDEIREHLIVSKFRHKDNLCAYMFCDLLKILDKAYLDDLYRNCKYVSLTSKTNFDEFLDKDMVCFNDTQILDDFELTKKKLLAFLNKKFPNKSKYEV